MWQKGGEQWSGLQELIRLSEDTLYVRQDDFKSSKSKRFVMSDGFGLCNGIAFLDTRSHIGALAHISRATRPEMLVAGKTGHVWGGEWRDIEKLSDVYSHPEDVQAINVYHCAGNSWWPEIIEEELAKIGIVHVQHVPLTTRPDPSQVYHRCIAIDTKKELLYIFPNNRTALITVPFKQPTCTSYTSLARAPSQSFQPQHAE